MIVLKFGGTSVGSAEWIDKAIDITQEQLDRAPVVVASAMAKVTDKLVKISEYAKKGDADGATGVLFNEIKELHYDTARAFLSGKFLDEAMQKLDKHLKELSSLIKGLILLREVTPRSSDALLSFGELLSTILIASRAQERGINTILLDSRDLVKTTDDFMHAVPLFDLTNRLIRERIKPEKGVLYVVQGFIGSTELGVTTTLGRGGSDYTATIYGAALDAEEVQIWTDVDGIMTTDPRTVNGTRTIPKITYEEAAELAYFGAKVVHPSTIQPAVEKAIPVLVKNTKNPKGPDTVITHKAEGRGLRAIAGKKGITVINVESSRMLNAYGFLSRIFVIFEKYRTAVDLIATSEVSVSMTIDNVHALHEIVAELETLGTVSVEQGKSIICLVGQELWKDTVFISRVFASLTEIPVRMISLGSSDINLSLVVPGELADAAIQKLHKEFFNA